MNKIRSQPFLYLIIILSLVIISYSNSLTGEYQFDDDLTVVENNRITDLRNFIGLNWAKEILNATRPVTELTFAVNYAIHGLNVTGYHVFNLIVHLIVVILVYVFTKKTLDLHGHSNSVLLSLVITGVFGLHPVQTQAVSYISQRYESLASLFYLLSLIMLINAKEKGMTVSGVMFYCAGVISLIAGIGAKEIVVTLPVIFLLYDFYFVTERPFFKRILFHVPFIMGCIFYLIFRMHGLLQQKMIAGFGIEEINPVDYLLTQFRVIVTYLRLIVFPVNQNLDYDFQISKSFFDPETIAAFIFLIMIITAAYLFRKRSRAASFGVFWFFIVISPTSSFVPVIDVIFEHRIYLAMWGIVMALTIMLYDMYVKFFVITEKKKKMAVLIISAVIISLGIATYERNKVWQTKMSLWQDVVAKSPNKSRPHNNLGNCYFLQGDLVSAINEYKKAVSLVPVWMEAYYNLGLALEKAGRTAEAVHYYIIFAREAPDMYKDLKIQLLNKYGLKE